MKFKASNILYFLIIISGCKLNDSGGEHTYIPTIVNGFWGQVKYYDGDFMPGGPGYPNGTGKIYGISKKIYFTDSINYNYADSFDYQTGCGKRYLMHKILNNIIDSTISDSNGYYQKELVNAKYTIIILTDTCFYYPFLGYKHVLQDSLVKLNIDLTYDATF